MTEAATLAEKFTTEGLSRGYSGTAKTIRKMHELVAKGKLDPSMHEIATLIRLSVPEDLRGSGRATAEAIYRWVKKHGVFQRDPFQIERIDHPISSMKSIIAARKSGSYNGPGLFVGDCDTFSIWTAALGGLLGFNYAFETAKVDAMRPEEFSHVWTALRVGPDWIAYDASTPRSTPGWRPPMSSQEQFKRWPEPTIEDTMGMGEDPREDILPMDYFGNGVPKDFDWSAPTVEDVDPGNLSLLIPTDTQIPMAEMEAGVEEIAKEEIPLAGARPSLTEGDMVFDTGPRYAPPPSRESRYSEMSGPYPVGSRWNRIQHDDSDRSSIPGGTRIHLSPSTVPSKDVDIVDGISEPIVSEENMGSINGVIARATKTVRTRILRRGGNKVIMRPKRVAAGMGADIVTSLDDPAAEATSSVWGDIASVLKPILSTAGNVAQTAITARAQNALANATARLSGGSVMPQQTAAIINRSSVPYYKNPVVIAGAAVAVLGLGYLLTQMGGKK